MARPGCAGELRAIVARDLNPTTDRDSPSGVDPDLTAVVQTQPAQPEHIRSAILVLLAILALPVGLACRLGGPSPWAVLAPVWALLLLAVGISLGAKALRRREEKAIARLAHSRG